MSNRLRKVPLLLELLEDRFLPAFYLVQTLADNSNAVDIGHAGTQADPFLAPSLRSALNAANGTTAIDDTIVFAPGLTGTITLSASLGALPVTDDVTITGPGATQLAVSGNNATRVFNIDDGTTATLTVVINGLTITGGSIAGSNGGGIFNRENLTLRNSTLSGNFANGRGGGGLYNSRGTVTVLNSTVSGNTASAGGGLYNRYGTMAVLNSTLSGNSAVVGGGLINFFGTATVENSTLSGNSAQYGGGLHNLSGSATVQNSTLSGNTAGTGGGGVSTYQGTVTVRNSIVANSLVGAELFNQGGTFDIKFSLIEDGSHITAGMAGNISGDPNLGPLQNNGGATSTHALLAGSTALNAGDPAFAPPPANDQRGAPFARVFGGRLDLGAFESQTLALVVDTLADEDDDDFSSGDRSLREALRHANANPGADTITFANSLSGGTITLTMGELAIFDDVTITGLGATNLAVSGNHASRVFDISGGSITVLIEGLTITAGSADVGGGISNSLANLTLRRSTLSGNTAGSIGGGLSNNFGMVTVQDSTLSGNSAGGVGGGLSDNLGTLTVQNSTLSGNSAGSVGGGLSGNDDTLMVLNSTLSGNSAGNGGGLSSNFSTVTVRNSIVANSLGGGDLSNNSGTFDIDFSLIEDGSRITPGTDGNLAGDPNLGPLQNNGGPTFTHALLPGSTALNAGDPAFVPPPANDQRGAPFARIFGGRLDLGAYEAHFPLVVDTLADEDDGDYSAADFSLREALAVANAQPGADTITFANSLSGGTITLTLGQLTITDAVTITGLGATQLAISGNNASRVFLIDDDNFATALNVVMDGLTITGGSTSSHGGGISNSENLTVQNSTLSGNSASREGGGLRNTSGTVTVQNSTLSGNSARFGGGLENSGGTVTVQNSTLSGNSAVFGGGLENNGGTLTVQNSTLSGNSAEEGGGVHIQVGTVTLRNSTLSGNSADQGGGVSNYDCTLTLQNSTVAGNSANKGGGLLNFANTTTLANTIVAGNTAATGPDLREDDFFGDGSFVSQGHNLIGDANGSTGFTDGMNGDKVGVANPGLGPLADNGGPTLTHALLPGSPALDAGDPAFTPPPTNDQRGAPFARVLDGNGDGLAVIDIGAVEANISIVLTPLAIDRNFYVDDRGVFENFFGGDEKWLRGNANSFGNSWYFLTPAGDLFEWNGAGLGGHLLLNVGSNGWENPELVVNAANLSAANPAELQAADQARAFYRASAGNYFLDVYGGDEKWIKGLTAAKSPANRNNPWYFILPNGSVHEWDGTPGSLTGTPVAGVTPDVNLYEEPSLLYDAFQDMSVNSAGRDEERHFYFDRSGGLVRNLLENYFGADEKWFRGDTNSFGNPWYFVLPGGNLVEWNGNAAATGNVLANLGSSAWNNLERVVSDFHASFTVGVQQGLIDLDQTHGLFRASNDVNFLFNTLGANEKWLYGATNSFGNHWYFVLPNNTLVAWNGSGSATGNVLPPNLPPEVYQDPLTLADAYADGSVLDDADPLDPFGPNNGGPGDTLL